MDKPQRANRSHLFVLRIQLVELGDGKKEWRGDIEYAASREKRYFRDWSVLLDFVQRCCEPVQLQAGSGGDFAAPE